MQPLTAPPREDLTAEQVYALLTGDEVSVSAGLELLDSSNQWVADISDDLVGGSVRHEGRATVHGACSLRIQRPLAWGRDRVRPYMTLSNAAVSARFNLGVYVLTTPRDKRGETPATFDVQGYDLLQPLLDPVGDTYVVEPASGANLCEVGTFESAGDVAWWESNPVFGFYTPATFARVTTKSHSGAASLEVTWAGGDSWVDTVLTGLIPGKTYRFSAWVWVSAGSPDPRISTWDFGYPPPIINGPSTAVKDTWVEISLVTTARSTDLVLGVLATGTTAGQKMWVDDVVCEPLSTTCLDAVRAVIELAGGGADLLIDGTEQVAVMPGPMVWALTESDSTTWLDICNDLLDAVGYGPLWADQDGNYRSEPFVPAQQRPTSWTFDVGDERTSLVGEDRTFEQDVWAKPNRWKFVRLGMAVQPVEGDGIYTVNNVATGPSSQRSLGRIRRAAPRYLSAVDQTALVAQGDRIVAEETAAARTITISVDPLPIAGHLDVVSYVDDGDAAVAEVVSWELPLDGSQGQWVLEVVQ